MPPQGLRHIISAFRALPTSLPRCRHSVLVFAPFILCTLTITVTITSEAQTTAHSARPDARPYPYPSNELGDSCAQTFTVSVNDARAALEAASVLVLRYISPLVRHRAVVARSASDNHISSQALTAIILCSAIVFCVLVGCILQLPAAYISLRNRYFRSGSTVPRSGNSTPGLFDVEMGDQDMVVGSLDGSPPPPYSRAPSYESCGVRDNDTSTGGRSEHQSTS